jgi:serine/threonine-protein kinase
MRSLLTAYTNLVEIGRGGMATVYRATSADTGHLVAIKVLDMHLVNDPTARARFAQEASFRLQHPNIIRVIEHDVDARGSTPYIVMEYVAGESLEQRLQREGKQTPKAAMPILKDIASGLDYAHSQNVIHRDVKPNNILIRAKNGQALLADFGIAKTASFTAYTATLARVGSVLFMSPEQAAGDPSLTPSSDIYSLGVTAYYALSGRHPFEGEDQVAIARQHMDETPPHLSVVEPSVPRALGDVVMRALQKQPLQRPGSAGELVRQMERAYSAPVAQTMNGMLQGGGVPIGAGAPTGVVPQVSPAGVGRATPATEKLPPLEKPGSGLRWQVLMGLLGIVILGLLCGLLALLWPGITGNNTSNTRPTSNGTATRQAVGQPITSTASATSSTNGAATSAAGTPGTPNPNATATIGTIVPTTFVLQTATPPTVVVIVPSTVIAPTLMPYVPEPTSTRVPRFPVIIPTATQPVLFPPTPAPPTSTSPPPSVTPTVPTPTPSSTPTITPSPTATPTEPPTPTPTLSPTLEPTATATSPAATPEPTSSPTVTIVP